MLESGHRLVVSNELVAEVIRVLRNPKFQHLFSLTDAELLEYAQLLQGLAEVVMLDGRYVAPLRDPSDLVVLQTAERGRADVLCSNDGDFHDPAVVAFCAARGIEVCDEAALLARLSAVAS